VRYCLFSATPWQWVGIMRVADRPQYWFHPEHRNVRDLMNIMMVAEASGRQARITATRWARGGESL